MIINYEHDLFMDFDLNRVCFYKDDSVLLFCRGLCALIFLGKALYIQEHCAGIRVRPIGQSQF